MSVQFGRWYFDGRPLAPDYLAKAKAFLAPHGPDNSGSYGEAGIGILYQGLHTTKESRCETQPHVTPSGAVVSWDGRLDNRAELIALCNPKCNSALTAGAADVAVVAAAYQMWGTNCFAKLIGDWALSIWDAHARSLILAKDFAGTRPLFYSRCENQITWSSILDPLVLLAGKTFALEEEYIAGWLSFFPATHLTPYGRIHSVPPSSFVLVQRGKHTVHKYWDFDARKKIRYPSDAEYEEHFRAVFAEAVRRRLRSNGTVIAELSGGMDSSAIVCMADRVLREETVERQRLKTISYFSDSEPNWNERPYFAKVEEQREQTGFHIDLGSEESFAFQSDDHRFQATPGSCGFRTEAAQSFAACVAACGSRVVLSGIGGDEVLGGVPTPAPELADLLARGRLRTLAGQLKVWALHKRKPWFHLLFEAAHGFLPQALAGVPEHARPAPWLDARFASRQRAALWGYESRMNLFGALPSFQENLSALDMLRRQLAASALPCDPPFERRYPYLDRDLLAFVYAVPREQIVRPGQRRSLMRRALGGIVPKEILERKRKAFVSRGPWMQLRANWPEFLALTEHMVSGALGIMRSEVFVREVQQAFQGGQGHLVRTLRTIALETWLRGLERQGTLALDGYGMDTERSPHRQRAILADPVSSRVQLADHAKRKGRR